MSDALLVQRAFLGDGMEKYLRLTRKRHQKYAELHGFDFSSALIKVAEADKYLFWWKVEILQRALERGYQRVVWLDADAYIADLSVDLREACPADGIGVVQFTTLYTHWNVGVMYLGNGERVREFMQVWLAKREDEKNEQEIFNQICDGIVMGLPCKWNYTLNRHTGEERPVVRGFHGQGTRDERYLLMRAALEREEQ